MYVFQRSEAKNEMKEKKDSEKKIQQNKFKRICEAQ